MAKNESDLSVNLTKSVDYLITVYDWQLTQIHIFCCKGYSNYLFLMSYN